MDPAQYNKALAMTGSGYRLPVDSSQYANQMSATMQRQEAEQRQRMEDAQAQTQGLVNLAATLYTGGAFGAAKGATTAASSAAGTGASTEAAGAAAPATSAAGGFADGAMSEAIKQAGAAGAGQQAASSPGMLKGLLGKFGGL